MFWWKFDSVTRRAGSDPATFLTELEILAVRGFGDMGTHARNRLVRNRFIADQRHIDSVPPDMPIREIVDCCRVWESHSEQKRGSSPAADGHLKCKGMSSDPWEFESVGEDLLWKIPRSCGIPEKGKWVQS